MAVLVFRDPRCNRPGGGSDWDMAVVGLGGVMTYWVNVYEGGAGNPWRDKRIAVLATVAKHNPLYRIKVTLKGKV